MTNLPVREGGTKYKFPRPFVFILHLCTYRSTLRLLCLPALRVRVCVCVCVCVRACVRGCVRVVNCDVFDPAAAACSTI